MNWWELKNNFDKLTFMNIIPFIVLISLLIIMSLIYLGTNKDNQKLKNKLFLSWLIGLTIILIIAFYDIIINEFGYLHERIDDTANMVIHHEMALSSVEDDKWIF
jgi:hypothetical protein